MTALADLLFGPLAGPECRRAIGRGWVLLLRSLSATAMVGVALAIFWFWWISELADPSYRPGREFRAGLMFVEAMAVTIALVMSPALLAGTLAGEKGRGTLALLLTTRVGAREIVSGRLAGKLSQVAMILLAGLPGLVLLATMSGVGPSAGAALVGLPAAVAFGGGGLAVAASAVSRRGVQALLAVYLLDVLFLLGPMAGLSNLPPSLTDWVALLNPFVPIKGIVDGGGLAPGLVAIGIWAAFGLAGAAFASWRLRPSCLASGEVGRRGGRSRSVPPVGDRPMLWKELYIERVTNLGWFGRVLGLLLVVGLAGGALLLAGLYAWATLVRPDPGIAADLLALMAVVVGDTGTLVSWTIQWAIGIRGAVAIASERERGTWDGLLTSPLEGKEIVRGKLWGAFHALRWPVAAAVLAWTLGLACGVVFPGEYATRILDTLVIGAFMAAAGIRASLSAPTAARAMATTIGVWLGAQFLVRVAAGLILLVLGLWYMIAWTAAAQAGLVAAPAWPAATWMTPIRTFLWPLTTSALYLSATVILVGELGTRFDRLAGRMTEGKVALAVDRALYGRPRAPRSEPSGERRIRW